VLADRQDADKIYGRNVETGTPSDGQVMVWRSGASEWQYENQSGSGGDGDGSSGSGSNYVQVLEDLTSQIPAISDHFDTAYVFDTGTLNVYYNGTHQQPSKYSEDVDYTGFTTNFSPVSGDTLVVTYFRGISSGSGASAISLKEQDESPALANIHTIIVGNSDLTDEGGGFARLRTASDVVVGVSDQDVLMMQIFS
jgi:hypothetical protein